MGKVTLLFILEGHLCIYLCIVTYCNLRFFRIMNEKGEKKLTAYLIHSLPLLMSAVQIFCG